MVLLRARQYLAFCLADFGHNLVLSFLCSNEFAIAPFLIPHSAILMIGHEPLRQILPIN
jgi:hypothetical protein